MVERAPRAAAFIVTIYGDVVEPRGGVLWMGNLIEMCGRVGLSESVVRTAVSRLVAANQLVGERQGRRSFYRLTEAAQREYAAAGAAFYGPRPGRGAGPWCVVVRPGADLGRQGFAPLGRDVWLGPWVADLPGAVFRAEAAASEELRALVAQMWPLDEIAAAYRQFVADWSGAVVPAEGAAALAVRLRLVHAFRGIVLRDPGLPAPALPETWPEDAARAVFAGLYQQLSPSSDGYIAEACLDLSGPLPPQTQALRARAKALSQVVSAEG